ncbi:MAG TPA: hypothetical protein VIL48_01565 [Acidimicrobiales bacterium]
MRPWRRAAACSALTVAALPGVLATACSSDDDAGSAGRVATSAPSTSTPGAVPGSPGSAPSGAPGASDPVPGPGAPGQPGGPPAGPTTTAVPTVPVGERVMAAGYELIVHGVVAPAPSDAVTPGPGHMLMAVDVEIVNRTASARDATYLRFAVVDTNGARYRPLTAGDNPPTGWLAADAPERGVQLYEVPVDAAGLLLTMQPDLVSGVAATVRLR